MEKKYLLDTCTIVRLLNGRSKRVFFEIMRHDLGNIYVSEIVVAELMAGVYGSDYPEKTLEKIKVFLDRVQILAFDYDDAVEYGKIIAPLQGRGRMIGKMDAMIAGQARRRGMIVVTNNLREFTRVSGLSVEDWC